MKRVFRSLAGNRYLSTLSQEDFAREAAHFLSTLNAIHPFREGNGRTQTAFFMLLAKRAGHPIDLEQMDPEQFLGAMIVSFKGDNTPLEHTILALTATKLGAGLPSQGT